ncbi:MAG: hypothetical protein R3B46_00475 [Phycisphaerales bacterium]
MNKQPRPHVSRAILHLRRSISVVSLVLALALIGQVLGWGIVHFTEARFADLSHEAIEPPDAVHEPVVVVNNEKPKQVASMTPSEARPEPADVNRVEGRAAEMLKGFLNLTQTVGIIMSITLVVLMLQAVSVAGGASIPGVEMAVTATTWAIILALLCVPMSMIIPEAQYPGVFVSYQTIADASEAYRTHAPERAGIRGVLGAFRDPASRAHRGADSAGVAIPRGCERGHHHHQRVGTGGATGARDAQPQGRPSHGAAGRRRTQSGDRRDGRALGTASEPIRRAAATDRNG